MSMSQRSRPSGWQNGMSSWVRLAAIVPATIAVAKMGPFAVAKPAARSRAKASCGKRRRACALATRSVGCLAVTTTIDGRPAASTCDSVCGSSANVVHLDLAQHAFGGRRLAQFAVAVIAPPPGAANQFDEFGIAGAGAHRRAQVGPGGREQAGVKHAVGGQARARAVAAEWLGHGPNESDLARTVGIGVTFRDLAAICARDRLERMRGGD